MIKIYTDTSVNAAGIIACSAILLSEENYLGLVVDRKECSLGNTAGELYAILLGLRKVKGYTEPVTVYTDSKVAIGIIKTGKCSRSLKPVVREIQTYANVKYRHIKAHRAKYSPNSLVDIMSRKVGRN